LNATLELLNSEYKRQPNNEVHGIPSFVDKEYMYAEAYQTISLPSLAMKIGWRKALSAHPNVYLKEYIMNPRRLCFTHLCDIRNASKILDVGAGWGSISLPLAKGFPDVSIYSLDKTLESLLFLKNVRDQEELHNLKVVHGDAWDIPFHDDFFDHVLMTGVLEYLGMPYLCGNPRNGQLKALKEVYRVLRSGGTLLIGTENRVGYQYFLGKTDHSGLRYTSLMPRFLADLYCKARIGESYRMYTYTESGYRRLLESAGFGQVKIYVAFKTYRDPLFITDLTSVKEMIRLLPLKDGKPSMLIKMARRLPNTLLKMFAPHFFLHAIKQRAG